MSIRFFKRRSRSQDIDDEFEAHIALESQLLQQRGLTRQEAESRARRSFGNRSLIAEETREAWICTWLDTLWQDLTYAARTLRRNPAFTPAVILSIALGVGAGTAVYSVADSVFFRPLPYLQPERLMWVAVTFPEFRMEFLGSPDYVAWRRDNHAFENLAAAQAGPTLPMLLNGENAAEVQDIRVSANFLQTLGTDQNSVVISFPLRNCPMALNASCSPIMFGGNIFMQTPRPSANGFSSMAKPTRSSVSFRVPSFFPGTRQLTFLQPFPSTPIRRPMVNSPGPSMGG